MRSGHYIWDQGAGVTSGFRHGLNELLAVFWMVDCVWNVMAHEQKPDFVFRRNGRVDLHRRGASVQSTTGSRVVRISLQGLYCSCKPVFCSHVTLTGYPLHSLVSPSLLLPCVTVCHHISTGLYPTQIANPTFRDNLSVPSSRVNAV
jgi:hypothetical protein